jgi:hypothetical protein
MLETVRQFKWIDSAGTKRASHSESGTFRAGADFRRRDAFDGQHGLGNHSHLVVHHFRREDLCEAAFHLVNDGNVGFAKAEEFSVAAADDGQEFLPLRIARLAVEHHDLLPVECFGRRFGHVKFLIRLGARHPNFQCHDNGSGRVRNAHQACGRGKIVFCVFIGKVVRHEHERAVRADQEKCRRQPPHVAHGKIRVMLGVDEQVIQRFGFWLRLHAESLNWKKPGRKRNWTFRGLSADTDNSQTGTRTERGLGLSEDVESPYPFHARYQSASVDCPWTWIVPGLCAFVA